MNKTYQVPNSEQKAAADAIMHLAAACLFKPVMT